MLWLFQFKRITGCLFYAYPKALLRLARAFHHLEYFGENDQGVIITYEPIGTVLK